MSNVRTATVLSCDNDVWNLTCSCIHIMWVLHVSPSSMLMFPLWFRDDPHQFHPCGHSFCRECAEIWLIQPVRHAIVCRYPDFMSLAAGTVWHMCRVPCGVVYDEPTHSQLCPSWRDWATPASATISGRFEGQEKCDRLAEWNGVRRGPVLRWWRFIRYWRLEKGEESQRSYNGALMRRSMRIIVLYVAHCRTKQQIVLIGECATAWTSLRMTQQSYSLLTQRCTRRSSQTRILRIKCLTWGNECSDKSICRILADPIIIENEWPRLRSLSAHGMFHRWHSKHCCAVSVGWESAQCDDFCLCILDSPLVYW